MYIDQIKKIEFQPFKLIEENNKIFLFAIENNGLYEIENKTIAILEQEGKSYENAYNSVAKQYERDEFESIIKNMHDCGFLKKEEVNCEYVKPQPNTDDNGYIKALTLMIVQECNLRCTYCYGDGGEYSDKGKMEREIAIKSVDFLIENSIDKKLLIAFLGGEPLMNFQLIREVIEYCKEKEKEIDKTFGFTMTTNGTIMNDEIERFLRENHVSVQISIDGKRDIQDKNRHYSKGSGSYDIVINKTKNMREDNLLSARATITNINLDLVENFEHLENMGFKSIPMAPAHNLLSDNDYKKLINESQKLIKLLEELIKKGNYKKASKIRIYWNGLSKIHNATNRNLPCGVGRNTYTVDINGDLYPCHRFVANKEYKIGDIKKGVEKRTEFLREIDISNHEQCERCWAKNLCVGSCPNENLVETGSTQISSTRNCEFVKSIFEELLKVYIRLTENEKQTMFKSVKEA